MGIITRRIPHYTQPQEAAVIRSEYRNNLLGYFPNDALATPTHDLTFAGEAAYGVTKFGRAILYDGTGDYTTAGDAFYSDEYTILVTFNANLLNADNKGVIVKRNLGTGAGTNELWLEVTSTAITFHVWNGPEKLNISAAISPVAGKTYTVGLDIPPGSGTAYMYVNGALVATGSKTGAIVNGTAELQFGALVGGAIARYWNGYIGPAAFWSKRRSDTQQLSANPWQILTPRRRQIYVSSAGGSVTLGLNTETDTALAISASKSVTLGLVTDTSTAQAITVLKSATLGINTETDTALSITTAKAVGLGLNTETDTAQPLTFGLSVTLGLASETDTAAPLTAQKTLTAGMALETDTASEVSGGKALSLGLLAETDTAPAITAGKAFTLGLASETDTAQPLGSGLSASLGLASETDIAHPVTVTKSLILGIPVETQSAQPIAATKSITLGLVTEAEFAQAVTYYRSIGVLQAAETDSVFALSSQKALTLGIVSETDFALALVLGSGTGDPPDAIFTVPSERRIFKVASERRIFNS